MFYTNTCSPVNPCDHGVVSSPGPFVDLQGLDAQRIWEGVVGRVVEGERATLVVIELDPDSHVPEHSHENEQLGVLVAGLLEFRIGDETRRVEPGGTWCIPANVPHEVQTGPEGAVAVEAFAPPRTDWSALERLDGRLPRWPVTAE
jgi:quercetin dioxygenase-like cupin family protein